jgi:hypothetical protein
VRRPSRRGMLRFAVLLMTCCSAFGQRLTAAKSLENNPNFRAVAEKTFLQYEDSLSIHCKQITPDWVRAQQTVYVAPVSNAENRLTSAIWSEMVPGTACGQPRNFRALVVVRDGRISLTRQLPGTSNTTPLLERDARVSVMGALLIHHPHEELKSPLDVLDTELVGVNPPPAHQAWKEVWLVQVNGREMRVPIEFMPDQPGGSTDFHINPKDITDVPPTGGA